MLTFLKTIFKINTKQKKKKKISKITISVRRVKKKYYRLRLIYFIKVVTQQTY